MDFKKKLKLLSPSVRKNFSKALEDLQKNIDVLYELATIDEKTEVYNHNFFKTISEMELEKAKRGSNLLSLLILDLDHFKKINDIYGHLVGDAVLKRLGQIFKESTRKYDIVSRFGGEEFIILFPNTNIKRAKEVSERLRKKVEQDKELRRYNVTFSGGVSSYHQKDSLVKMKQRADKALYKAKNNGRNKIETE
ncbi:GGDEF domain-containing protein [Candidatus Pacearchaeota archaeon]|nr:GGDEF domain-containing protein [Candidatus Pacearchaeota archaeon]